MRPKFKAQTLYSRALLARLLCLLTLLGLSGGARAQAVYQRPAPLTSGYAPLSLPVVCSRGAGVYQVSTNSDPNVTGAQGGTFRLRHRVSRSCTGIKLVYGNFCTTGNQPQAQANAITLAASVELPGGGGATTRVTFGGQASVTLQVGQFVTSDAVPGSLTAGTAGSPNYLWTRTFVTVPAGGKWPGELTPGSLQGEGYLIGTTATDNTMTSGTAWATMNNNQVAYSPLAVLGTPTDGAALGTVGVIGDSIGTGAVDGGWFADASVDAQSGFVSAAFQDRIGFLNFSEGSEGTSGYMDATRAVNKLYVLGCTHYIIQMGVNDLDAATTAASEEALRLKIIADLEGLGVPAGHIFQTTITPQTNSSDSWTTYTGQTARSGPWYTFSSSSDRAVFNAWVMSNPGGVRGLDVGGAVEDAANHPNQWKLNPTGGGTNLTQYVYDGTHPGHMGHLDMAAPLTAALNAGWFSN